MVGTPSNRYDIHYPDGTEETAVTLVGPVKQNGDTIERPNGKWIVSEVHLPKEGGEVWEITVKRPED